MLFTILGGYRIKTMKKIIIFLSILFFSFDFAYAGIVPCDTLTCTLCDFFQMISNLVNFIYQIAAPIAVLMIVIGGTLMVVSYISPGAGGEALTKARAIFKATAIGLLIVWGGWILLNAFLIAIGADPNWWQITC